MHVDWTAFPSKDLEVSAPLSSPSSAVIAYEKQLGSTHPQKPHETSEEHVHPDLFILWYQAQQL